MVFPLLALPALEEVLAFPTFGEELRDNLDDLLGNLDAISFNNEELHANLDNLESEKQHDGSLKVIPEPRNILEEYIIDIDGINAGEMNDEDVDE
ncbi:hypothetical protein FRX31_026965 [Thalictrum thalictroides]|uniref:Uncharacterized protein n=1 Tax=Thalictrum thalictroides TaxID=46969 RepID=A0A7J6VFD2_THATH|nr:hypothetical protein FRX31_026965 [Thalictrum thalictroides]